MQAKALPPAIAGLDVMVCAQTGSGKTLMFLLPMLHRLAQKSPPAIKLGKRAQREAARHGSAAQGGPAKGRAIAQPEALVVVPTRELGIQIATIARQLASTLDGQPVTVDLLTGGAPFKPQKEALARGDIRLLVATPARLLYHVEEGALDLGRVRQLAIDEADAVLGGADGIKREGRQVLSALPKQKPPQVRASHAHVHATRCHRCQYTGHRAGGARRAPHAARRPLHTTRHMYR